MTTPQKYAQNPLIANSGIKYSSSHKSPMLIIKTKKPKLKAIMGDETIITIGLIKKLINPKSKPAIINVKISPLKLKFGIKRAARNIAKAFVRI